MATREPAIPVDASAPNLVITGFMGTGKTTIGKRVAALTGRPFIDTDDEITRRVGKSIPSIFRDQGEAAFREYERRLCRALAHVRGLVIATGGGMLINAENRALMMKSGLVICLDADPDVIEARLSHSHDRPLAATWRDLYASRRAAYAEIPTHFDTSAAPTNALAEEIAALWRSSM